MENTNTLTKSETSGTVARRDINHILALNKITPKDIEDFTNSQRKQLAKTCDKKLKRLTGAARDNFLEKIDLLLPASTKNDIWESNHMIISETVAELMQEYGTMPTKHAIAAQTGISRQTIAKHLNEYKRHPAFTEQVEQFKFMAPQLLANVFKFALQGDIRAARLYLETVGAVNKPKANTVVNEQNNYIQVNNTILSQENLKRLTADQLNQIESIITLNERKTN
ncbi:MAG: hypothetical protein ABI203_07065 [Mucilaginibacter sp.]